MNEADVVEVVADIPVEGGAPDVVRGLGVVVDRFAR